MKPVILAMLATLWLVTAYVALPPYHDFLQRNQKGKGETPLPSDV